MTTRLYWETLCEHNKVVMVADAILRGCSQVMFQNNPLTGLLFFIAIFVGAWEEALPQVAFGCLLGTATSTLSAMWLVDDHATWRNGLYGYNGCLVGTALPTFLLPSVWLWGGVIFSSVISVIVTIALNRLLRTWKIAALTAPFVLVTWTVLLASYPFSHLQHVRLPSPGVPTDGVSSSVHPGVMEVLSGTLHSVSQVFLCSSVTGGLLLLLGLVVSSPRAMLLGFFGALLGVETALAIGASPQMVFAGLYAFSAVLTAVALGSVFNPPGGRVLLYTLIGVIFTVLVQGAFNALMAPLGIPSLTMPFVIASWLFLSANPAVFATRQ
ncbi:urea transporter [Salmonella enterica subsp. salamae]|nr:urea transporter [Salmonella enterica subsp. salamae]ECF6094479.1 urea transporter [Salmonella enterica subsp. salamae]EDW5993895.1 urea transporter [Salmonella enterica subsp. salamae]